MQAAHITKLFTVAFTFYTAHGYGQNIVCIYIYISTPLGSCTPSPTPMRPVDSVLQCREMHVRHACMSPALLPGSGPVMYIEQHT